MKKLLLITIGFLAAFCFSQVRFGAKGAVQGSNIRNVHTHSESRIGYLIGGFAQIPLDYRKDQLFFQPELIYTAIGETNNPPNIGEQEIYLGYLRMPLMLKAFFNEQDSQFFGEIGPYLAFLVNEQIDGPANSEAVILRDEIESFDFGAAIGIGYSINRKFEIFTRFSLGFVDLYESDLGTKQNANFTFQGGIAYIFN